MTSIEPAWAFYSLPTRAWQIALGALIATVFVVWPRPVAGRIATGLGLLGVLLIAAAAATTTEATPYPGWAALLPAAGAAMLIVAGEHRGGLTTRALSAAVSRWFGRISYSLYLWHWPLLIIAPVVIGRDGLRVRLLLAIAAIGIAAISTRYVENPFRSRTSSPQPANRRTLALAGAFSLGVATTAILASLVIARPTTGPAVLPPLDGASVTGPERLTPVLAGPLPPDVVPSLFDARTDRGDLGPDDCQTTTIESDLRDCVYGNPDSDITAVVFGDSHAGMWFPAMQRIAAERDWRLIPLVKFGCTPVEVTVWDNTLKRAFHECDTWRTRALARIAEERPAITFVVTSRNYQVADHAGNPVTSGKDEAWKAGYVSVLRELRGSSMRVVVMGETPHMHEDPLECLAKSGRIEACQRKRVEAVNAEYRELEEDATAEAGVELMPTVDWLCSASVCPLVLGDFLVYRNPGHLTATVTAALAPQILWALDHPQ